MITKDKVAKLIVYDDDGKTLDEVNVRIRFCWGNKPPIYCIDLSDLGEGIHQAIEWVADE